MASAIAGHGASRGTSRVSGRGRPLLRLAAWRAIWGTKQHNPVYAARFTYLTTRGDNPLSAGQAHVALVAALLRQIHVVVTHRVRWNPTIAAGAQREVTHTQAA